MRWLGYSENRDIVVLGSACPSAIIDALPRKPQASPRVKMPKPQPIDLAVLLAPSLDAQL